MYTNPANTLAPSPKTATELRPPSEIDREVGDLRSNLEALHGRISVLCDRLAPVVMPQAESGPTSTQMPSCGSVLAQHLQSANITASGAVSRMDTLLSSLAL
jgi:hypothetical protein